MSRNTRITLALAIVLSVYMLYLLLINKAPYPYYLFPFFASPLDIVSYWINTISLIALALWVIWCVLFIRDNR